MKNKQCTKCKQIKSLKDFYKDKRHKDNCTSWCKKCTSKYNKQWSKNNPTIQINASAKYLKNNPNYVKEWRKNNVEHCREYYKNNAEKLNEQKREYYKNNVEKLYKAKKVWIKNNPDKIKEFRKRASERRQSNPKLKLNNAISCLIRQSLKGNKNGWHWETLVNFSLKELIVHLEKLFKLGMSWNNHGKWEIDHIRPISSFKFNSYRDKEFLECWSLSNLQPLWAKENRRKYNKILSME